LISLLSAELALSAWGPLAGTLGFSKRGIMNSSDGKPIHAADVAWHDFDAGTGKPRAG
jgi:hypothetical protein